jgi:lysophospholipase L1-like esterase
MEQFVSTSSQADNLADREHPMIGGLTSRKRSIARLAQAGKLGLVWAIASALSFLTIMVIYTLFFGRNKVILNETIYENHRYVGQAGASQLNTLEGHALTTFGENGLIVDKELDPHAFRVLFVGDSYVKAKQVSDRYKFTEVIERDWNAAHSNQPIQTLNLGLGGQDLSTYLSFGPNMDKHYQPHLVFLMLGGQDFDTLSRKPHQLAKIASGLNEPLTKPQTANLVERLSNDLGCRSFFGQLQLQTYGFLSSGQRTSAGGGHDQAGQPPADQHRPADKSSGAVAIQLEALQDIWGDRLVIIYRPSLPALSYQGAGNDTPDVYRDEMISEMEAMGIPYINLYSPFLQAFRERRPPFGFNNSILGQGHLNQFGHQLVADQVTEYLESLDGLF